MIYKIFNRVAALLIAIGVVLISIGVLISSTPILWLVGIGGATLVLSLILTIADLYHLIKGFTYEKKQAIERKAHIFKGETQRQAKELLKTNEKFEKAKNQHSKLEL